MQTIAIFSKSHTKIALVVKLTYSKLKKYFSKIWKVTITRKAVSFLSFMTLLGQKYWINSVENLTYKEIDSM